jgi:hypothetical protein
MTALSLTPQQISVSPFDAIRHYDENGNEFWKARELQKILGYAKWQKFEDAIDRAKSSLVNQGLNTTTHLTASGKLSTASDPVPLQDYKLSRHACYTIAMNGDPRKVEIAQAQSYFVAKTRQAELVIPAQNDRIRELELELAIQTSINQRMAIQDTRIALHGLNTTLLLEGKSDSVVEVDRPILKVIDAASGAKFEGQTTKQLADYLNKNGGRSFKSGAELERELNKLGRADLVDTVPRKTLQPFVSKQNLSEACKLLVNNRQQQLI